MCKLKNLAIPITTKLRNRGLECQSHLMQFLNAEVDKLDKKAPVYRICSVELIKFNKDSIQYNIDPPLFPEPQGLEPGYFLIDGAKIKSVPVSTVVIHLVHNILRQSKQLDYLHTRAEMLNEWRIITDVDFYYERPKGQIGFHKDTVGRSLFVNLNFNNQDKILGPEYILNALPIPEHEEHIKGKLPEVFLNDLKGLRSIARDPDTIYSTKIEANGMVSFIDEFIHHTTPYRDHRGLSCADIWKSLVKELGEEDAGKLRNLVLFVRDVKCNKVDWTYTKEELNKNFSLEERQINYLFKHIKEETISSAKMNEILLQGKNAEFLKMCQKVDDLKRDLAILLRLSCFGSFYSRKELLDKHKISKNVVDYMFNEHKKHDLDTVVLAGCEDHCNVDTKSKTHPLLTKGKPKLKRQMSGELDKNELPLVTNEKRQFIRTWVQVKRRENPIPL